MLFVLNRQYNVINVIRNEGGNIASPPYFEDEHYQELETGAEGFTFTTIVENNIAKDLAVGNHIAFMKNGKYKLFQIVATEEIHEDSFDMKVYCETAGLGLINEIYRGKQLLSVSFDRLLENILEDTDWEVGNVDKEVTTNPMSITLENDSVYSIIQDLLPKFEVEIDFRVEFKGNKLHKKYIDVYKKRGKDIGKRFEFGKNITGITRKVDSSELCTALIGFGNNDITFKEATIDSIDKPIGQDFVADQEAYDRYNVNGRHIFGIFNYETDSPYDLLIQTKKELEKRCVPKIDYEVELALLDDDVELGDTIRIVDNYFNPPLFLEARVNTLTISETDPSANKCTLSNFVELGSKIDSQMKSLLTKMQKTVATTVSAKFPVSEQDISDNAITKDKLSERSVDSSKIEELSIDTIHVKNESITDDKIKEVASNKITGNLSADSMILNVVQAINQSTEKINADKIASATRSSENMEELLNKALEKINELEERLSKLEK